MPQIFRPSSNTIARLSLMGAPFPGVPAVDLPGLHALVLRHRRGHHPRADRSPSATSITSASWASIAATAIPRSSTAPYAGMPPTQTCMNCHSQMWVGSDMLEPVARQLPHRPIAALAARLQPARLRLFRPQHPRPQGRRLLDLPRPHR